MQTSLCGGWELKTDEDGMHHLVLYMWIWLQAVYMLQIGLGVCWFYFYRTINSVCILKLKIIYPLSWSLNCIWLIFVFVKDVWLWKLYATYWKALGGHLLSDLFLLHKILKISKYLLSFQNFVFCKHWHLHWQCACYPVLCM